jgi:hypothetical protein
MATSKDLSVNIEQIRDALTENEIEHIQLLSSRNLFQYVRDKIILNLSDDEAREFYHCITAEADANA